MIKIGYLHIDDENRETDLRSLEGKSHTSVWQFTGGIYPIYVGSTQPVVIAFLATNTSSRVAGYESSEWLSDVIGRYGGRVDVDYSVWSDYFESEQYFNDLLNATSHSYSQKLFRTADPIILLPEGEKYSPKEVADAVHNPLFCGPLKSYLINDRPEIPTARAFAFQGRYSLVTLDAVYMDTVELLSRLNYIPQYADWKPEKPECVIGYRIMFSEEIGRKEV